MAHYTHASREHILALVEQGNYSVREAANRCGVSVRSAQRWMQQWRTSGSIGRLPGTGLMRVSTADEDSHLVETSQENPFLNSVELKQSTNFPGCPYTVRKRLQEAGITCKKPAIKECLTEEQIIDRCAFAELELNRNWDHVIFSDETCFSSAEFGPVLVYRPRGTRYDKRYVGERARSGRISVSCWGWISSDGAGVLHRIDGHLTSDQYLHILENIMIPSVRERYPDGVIQFMQDASPIHCSRRVQRWFSDQDSIEVLNWVPRAPDLNPIEHVWSKWKRHIRKNWPHPPPRSDDALWSIMLDAWEEIALDEQYFKNLVQSMPRRLQQVVEAGGYWTRY